MFVMAKTCISRSWLFCASGLLLIAAGCAQPTATVPVVAPPIPSGQARVWFYRPWEPSESLNLALIDMNGSYVGAAENGSAFYRDVPPGHITSRLRASAGTSTRTEMSTSPLAGSSMSRSSLWMPGA
jgi:hypothetical protein